KNHLHSFSLTHCMRRAYSHKPACNQVLAKGDSWTRAAVLQGSRNQELPAAHFCASAALAVTICGSANCSQKPIISSSLGSPQRTALDGSGFKGLFLELSK